MGRRMTGHKTTGANGTGTATFYKVTSKFAVLMMDYVKKEATRILHCKPFLMTNHRAAEQNASLCMTSTLILQKSPDWT